MEAQLDLESLRAKLKKLPRKRVRAIAIKAGLAPSTVEKFRGGHIQEPGFSKARALEVALAEEPAPPKVRKQARGG